MSKKMGTTRQMRPCVWRRWSPCSQRIQDGARDDAVSRETNLDSEGFSFAGDVNREDEDVVMTLSRRALGQAVDVQAPTEA